MKLKELIATLQKHDPELDVFCSSEDPDILAPGHGFRLFEIQGIALTEAQKTRLDGRPYLAFGAEAGAQRHLILEISTDV